MYLSVIFSFCKECFFSGVYYLHFSVIGIFYHIEFTIINLLRQVKFEDIVN